MIQVEDNKRYIPYIITMYGTLETDKESIEEMKEELQQTNIQYLINKIDSKFVELNEDELIRKYKDVDDKNEYKE